MEIKSEWTYHKKQEIGAGQGCNSKVFLVDDPQRGGEIVVKEILKANLGDPDKFFREAQAMFAARAANVVPLYCASQTADHICVAMPYYKNGSLASRIEVDPLSLGQVLKVGQEILLGLANIHSRKLLHFDVKPTNVFFDDRDVALIADFGQARVVMKHGVTDAPQIYDRGFAPEIFGSNQGVVQTDVYQAGLTLYRAVNGDPFFNQQCPSHWASLQALIASGKFPNRELFQPHVPKALRTVIRKSLKVKPSERFATASEFADALAGISFKHDWQLRQNPNGDATWTCQRRDQPTLRVVRTMNSDGTADVSIYTESSGKQRAKDKSKWRAKLSAIEAQEYLKKLFESMEL